MNITKQRLQQLAGIIPLNEITIKPIKSTKFDRWIKINFEKIYKSIEEVDDQLHNNTTLTLDNVDLNGISEIENYDFIADNYSLEPNELDRIPKDIVTTRVEVIDKSCDGILISNYGNDVQDWLGSGGSSWYEIPGTKYFYSYIEC